MNHFRTSVQKKKHFYLKMRPFLPHLLLFVLYWGFFSYGYWQRRSNWYYPFFLIGILLFICWATFIERHFDIVYIP